MGHVAVCRMPVKGRQCGFVDGLLCESVSIHLVKPIT